MLNYRSKGWMLVTFSLTTQGWLLFFFFFVKWQLLNWVVLKFGTYIVTAYCKKYWWNDLTTVPAANRPQHTLDAFGWHQQEKMDPCQTQLSNPSKHSGLIHTSPVIGLSKFGQALKQKVQRKLDNHSELNSLSTVTPLVPQGATHSCFCCQSCSGLSIGFIWFRLAKRCR